MPIFDQEKLEVDMLGMIHADWNYIHATAARDPIAEVRWVGRRGADRPPAGTRTLLAQAGSPGTPGGASPGEPGGGVPGAPPTGGIPPTGTPPAGTPPGGTTPPGSSPPSSGAGGSSTGSGGSETGGSGAGGGYGTP